MTDEKYGYGRGLDALSSRGFLAKREYVQELERRGDPDAVALLLECLCDESGYLRDLAEQAFMRMDEPRARVLIPLLEQGLWFTRTSAARILGRKACGNAVPALVRLTEDANETVANVARDALVAVGRQGGAAQVAHALHRLPPHLRRRRLDEVLARDVALGGRLEGLMADPELMGAEGPEGSAQDESDPRAGEEGVEWELLTGPPPPDRPPDEAGGGHAGSAGA